MRRAVAAAAGWVMLATGCEQPRTELVARVESEVAWGAGAAVQSVTLTVRRGGPTGSLRSDRTTALGMGVDRRPLPLSVGILPGDDTDTPVWIEALGCGGPNGCTPTTAVVAQRAVVRFTRGQTDVVTLLLASACVGVTCGSDERCGEGGRCEPATRAMARPLDGLDAAAMVDAGGVDAPPARDAPPANDLPAADLAPPVDVPLVDRPAVSTDIPCGALELRCGGVCVPALIDATNCGACGTACATGQTCVAGVCRTNPCPGGMRMIPAGQFLMGDSMEDNAPAQPVHGVRLTAFCMDEAEVTVAAYRACSTCTAPDTGTTCNWGVPGRDQHPVNCVDWNQARAYCQSLGGSLPTEAQWEYAARGTDGRTYPWGNDAPNAQLCWVGGAVASPSTCPVRMYPSGVSPFGIFDMAGNVRELTLDAYGAYAGDSSSYILNPMVPGTAASSRVNRGGWFGYLETSYLRATYRYQSGPSWRDGPIGFRCVHELL